MSKVCILSNWIAENGKKLNKVLTCSLENKECSIDDINVETCVCLAKNENDNENSKPEVEIRLDKFIKQIDVFSEGSLVEVFGMNNEYLFTCESNFVDDWEGMAVYHSIIILEQSSPVCNLKFTRIKDENHFWLYSIRLTVSSSDISNKSVLFNIENVNKLINGSGHQLSSRAEKFKNFFEVYFNNLNHQPINPDISLNLGNFITDLKSLNAKKANGKKNLLTFDLNTWCKNLFDSDQKLPICQCDKNNIADSAEEQFKYINYLQKYIDKKMIEIKQEIIKQMEYEINKVVEENNAKIMQKLQIQLSETLKTCDCK